MTPPRPSMLGWLTALGRLKNIWAKALAERDPARSVVNLRKVVARFSAAPESWPQLWVPFLTSLLDRPAVKHLTEDDLRLMEDAGARIARQVPATLSLSEAWIPIVAIRDRRGEPMAACDLMTRLYQDAGTAAGTKAGIAGELARRRATGDDHVAVYIDHLRGVDDPAVATGILALLAQALAIDANADLIRIKRAGLLARRLCEAEIPVDGTDLPLGWHYLTTGTDYALARVYLETALEAQPENDMALTGLLCAHLGAGEHRRVTAIAATLVRPAASRIEGLIELGQVLDWLDDTSLAAPPPVKAAMLAGRDLAGVVGDWHNFALGRLCLLEGDARTAADLLRPLAEAYPQRPSWAYHAAWAAVLTGDRDAVVRRFQAAAGWRGQWAIACLLMDADPSRAAGAEALLQSGEAPAPYTAVAMARAELATGLRHDPPTDTTLPRGGTPEEDMEALRTILGIRYARHDRAGIAELLATGTFQRLPRAEQLLWSGLSASLANPADGLADLERAHAFGYPRAALVLAVLHLRHQRPAQATRLLAGFAWRTDTKLKLLQGWAAAVETREGETTGQLDWLAKRTEPLARYAMGNLYLQQSVGAYAGGKALKAGYLAAQAVEDYRAALQAGAGAVPDDVELLASCAEVIASVPKPSPATIIKCARHWPTVRTSAANADYRWAAWVAAVSDLVCRGASADPAAVEYLLEAAVSAASAASAVSAAEALVDAVVAALTRVCLDDPGNVGSKSIARLLERHSGQGVVEIDRAYVLIAAVMARRDGGAVREAALQRLTMFARARPDHAVAVLVAAEVALRHGDAVQAARYLRDATPDDEHAREALSTMADLLQGRAPLGRMSARTPDDAPPEFALAVRIADAAALAGSDPGRCREAVVDAAQNGDVAGIVDLSAILSPWCAQAAQSRRTPEPLAALIRHLGQVNAGRVDPLLLARCATAVGETETAARVWDRVVRERTEPTVREEYVRFCCHQAVQARQRGDSHKTAQFLRAAAALADSR